MISQHNCCNCGILS